MSRLGRFSQSVLSGYVLLAANVLYTIASVPVALRFLSPQEFGLWSLSLVVSGYLALLDLGMSSSLARLLIDHKDDRTSHRYGSMLKTGLWVGAAQGAAIIIVGLSLLWWLPGWLKVPPTLARDFTWLLAGQIGLTAIGFPMRVFGQVLYAWQRVDLSNYAHALQFPVTFTVLWLGFASGWGVLAMLAANAAGWLVTQLLLACACLRLRLLPRGAAWGRSSWAQFRELFAFGSDIFLIALGTLLVTSSQAILVSRYLGMEATAVWSIATRAYTLVTQLVLRMVGAATPAFAEMHVRGETMRLRTRYRTYLGMLNWIAVLCAAGFAVGNQPFLALWTSGRIAWPAANDWLLALWLVASTQQAAHTSLLSSLKELRGVKYVLFAEGVVFFAVGIVAVRWASMSGLIATSVVCTLAFTWQYGARTAARRLEERSAPFWRLWQRATLQTAAVVLPLAWLAHFATRRMDPTIQLASAGLAVAIGGGLALRTSGFAAEFRQEMAERFRPRFPWIALLLGAERER